MPFAAVDIALSDVQEFMRVGYYVSTDYWEEEYKEMETPPNPPLIHKYAGAVGIALTLCIASKQHMT